MPFWFQGKVVAPTKTFADLRRNSSWWAPFVLISVVGLIFVFVMGQQIGFDQITKNEIARSPRRAEQLDRLSPAEKVRQLEISAAVTRYISYGVPVIDLIAFLLIAAVLLGTLNVAGASLSFKTTLAVVVYSSLPGLIGAVLGTVSMYAGVDREGFNVRNPVATNPAYFMDPMGNKFLYIMASALDVFVVWTIVLMGIGFACNSKIKRSSALAIVAGWYIFYKLLGAGLAAAFS